MSRVAPLLYLAVSLLLGFEKAGIRVGSPEAGATVSSPLVVRGEANVFEGNVELRVLNSDGRLLAEACAQADAELGRYGPFEAVVEFDPADAGEEIILEVFATDAKTGSEIHFQRLRLLLRQRPQACAQATPAMRACELREPEA